MERLLSIGEVAKRLRVSVDVVRSLTENATLKAVRTGGGHRRYRPEEVERFKATRRAPAKNAPLERPTRKPPNRADLEEPDIEEDQPTLEDLQAEFERQQVRERAESERQRLEGLKKYGRDLALWTLLPAEGRARVIEDLEEFVTSTRVPPSLSEPEAQVIVFARVQQIANEFRETENQRLAKEREGEDRRRKQGDDERRLKALIDHGINYARGQTVSGWDTSAADKARREVGRTLRSEVKVDWSDADVRDCVDDILAEWEDDDAEYEDYDEDEYEGDDEGEEDEVDDETW